MKKIWLGIGAALIVILLLLQTKFNIFMRMEESGYAISDDELKQTLMLDPDEIEEDITFPYYRFEALDYIYERGNKYYMGENKKTQIDLGFPLYVNGGAGILFTNDSSTLFDVDYEEVEVYSGLVVSERISYNPGGERADATEYLFCSLSNGLFINLDTVTYEDRGEIRDIDMNSIIYFTEEYFTYSEQRAGEGNYQVCRNISSDDIVTVNGEEMTYHELLIRLHVISEKNPKAEVPEEVEEEPVTPVFDDDINDESEDKEETVKEESEKDTKKEGTDKVASGKQSTAQNPNASTVSRPSKNEKDKQQSNKPASNQTSRGERPDSMRPDKNKTEEPVIGYVKPTVTVNNVTAGVYRIILDVTVDDPANRLHTLRKVQFEFYEVMDDGTEKLACRTYTGSSDSKLTMGNGSIKPSTTYRINAYFTYNDEYNKPVVESIPLGHISTLDDSKITTLPFSSLGVIDFASPVPQYYYDFYLELDSVRYADGSDEEAVYGINRSAGIKLIVEGNELTNTTFKSETTIDRTTIRNFKDHLNVVFQSAPNLASKSKYKFTIEAEDYFGNKLTVVNNTGEFETCKSRPVGTLEIKENKLGDFQMQVNVTDPDNSAIPVAGGTDYDMYLVFATQRSEVDPITKEECDAYLANGGSIDGGQVAYVYKFNESEYKNAAGEIDIDKLIKVTNLDLDVKYFAYLYCDYDLNNKKGEVRFGEIANLNFTSASLSSLGDIYVKVDLANVTAHSANISFTLNTDRTVDELEELLSSVRFNIVRTNGEEEITDSYIQFDTDAMTVFTTYDHGSNAAVKDFPWLPTGNPAGPVMMDANFFNGSLSEEQHALKNMTDYTIVPDIKATYNGKEYDMKVKLTYSSFKTLKEPATVEVENVLLAAGTLRFKVKINDPDEAIIGNSGHVVRMNLYQQDGTFVKALRIPKNTEDFQDIEIKNLASDETFKLTFIAVEYNEGYTNSTYESNKILKEVLIDDSLDLSGSLKLQDIVPGSSSSKLTANVKTTLNDKEKAVLNGVYYIQVQKNGEDVTSSGGYPASYPVADSDYNTNNIIAHDLEFPVDKGKNTYTLTLYVYINGQQFVLDTLTFTSEQTVEGISTAEEFVWKIKNNPSGKFVITDNISLDSAVKYLNPDDPTQSATPRSITSNFNGKMDFQGYSLDYVYRTRGSRLFSNLGSKSEISNMVFNVKMENAGSAVWDDGVFCRLNYGHIHDVMVNYKGGDAAKNHYIGLLCRANAVSGVIENFVVNNAPEEGTMPFSAWSGAGLVCGQNSGTIRNGYAYGDPIYTDIQTPSNTNGLRVGGIVGEQTARGRVNNVFSMVNVIVADKSKSADQNTEVRQYGSVAGYGLGRFSNVYGIGQSFYNNMTTCNTEVGPLLGASGGLTNNVYYWNENDIEYSDTTQTQIGLETLHDYYWQASILGDQFITSNVEVGYYPHVVLSEELPAQPYIPLPDRSYANLVELMSTTIVEYVDNKQAAIVEFRFSNTQNAEIQEINISNLTTEIDVDSISSVDGYTTLRAKVSNPTRFCSSYEIEGVECYLRGQRSVKFEPKPLLLVDFYRNITTPDEWYDYVVCQPTENARLAADIDFSGVSEDRIFVSSEYTGKLDGGSADNTSVGYAIKNITMVNNPYVFSTLQGEITNLRVENLTLGSESAVKDSPGFVSSHKGIIDNVHIIGESVVGYGYIGGMAGKTYSSSEITNSSVSNIAIRYKEPANTNTNGRIGGLVGNAGGSRIISCYVRDVDMKVEDIRNCEGAGGLVGYVDQSSIENVYSTGEMTVRGMSVGGVVGRYVNSEIGNCLKNVLSRTDVFSYQDKVGGIIGEASVNYVLSDRNNISGVALGNVFANNPNAENISYTIGDMAGATLSFHGSEVQLLNGMIGQEKDDNTLEILTLEQLMDPSTYTEIAEMDDVYNYSKAAAGNLPTLYYEGTQIELPFQTDISLSNTEVTKNEISVKEVILPENSQKIILELETPTDATYEVTSLTIENLLQDSSKGLQNIPASGAGRVTTWYLPEDEQEHWQDSYLLTKITYKKTVNGKTTVGYADFSKDPVRIPLVLYCDIYSVETWTANINENNNYGNYENYRVTDNIDFTGKGYTINAKLGRLKGATNNGMAKLSGINISGSQTNLIFRLNSELSNICFENCSVSSTDRDGIGLIGASAADIKDVEFKDIQINNNSANINFTGMIGYQVGGTFENISMENIEVNCKKSTQHYVGGLVGYSTGSTLYKNINAKNIIVTGSARISGMLGATSRASFEDITFEDINVIGRYSSVGGIVGENNSPRTSNNALHMWNVTVKGTPAKDANGRVTGSTTVIEFRQDSVNADYIGGIAGKCGGYQIGFGRTGSAAGSGINVEGIVVKGSKSYIGGAFGFSSGCMKVTVEDTLITNNNTTSRYGVWSRVGGVSGAQQFENNYNNVYNTTIDVDNYDFVGLLTGYKDNTGNTNYCYVHNSELKVKRTLKGTPNTSTVDGVGGLIGRTDAPTNYCGVYNSSILAENNTTNTGYSEVGGLIGTSNSTINRCFYYASPENQTSPVAAADYQVKGERYVGGLVGNQRNAPIQMCYSNATVKADYYAGGLVGRYANGYVISTVSGKTVYNYSNVALNNCYFAGKVTADKNYAGGAIGCNTMATMDSGTTPVEHRESGGRNTATDGGYKSGAKNEADYTYSNLILAQSVSAGGGKAYAFSGTQDGFEGKANKNKTDITTKDKASRTYFFAGMKVGTTGSEVQLYDMKNADAPDYAKNSGTYRYKLWNQGEYTDSSITETGWISSSGGNSTNVRLVTTDDMKGNKQYKMFAALGWIKSNPNQTATMKGDNYRLLYSGADNQTEWNTLGDASTYRGKDYLPHLRSKSIFAGDTLIKKQSDLGIALPIPEWSAAARATTAALSLDGAESYAVIYPVDADKINVEFSQDLVDAGGYFTLVYGSSVIDKQLITKRVYTYSYDYLKNLKLSYGTADVEGFMAQMEAEGKEASTDYMLGDIFYYNEFISEPAETIDYKAAALERHVMVYGNEYYYISDEGIVHGSGSSAASSNEDAQDEQIEDASAQTLGGSYITIYNGHALTEDGNVVDVTSGSTIRTVEGFNVLDNPIPMQAFQYDGFQIESYAKFAEIIGADVVARETQILKGNTGLVGFIDSRMENIKDSLLLYTKDEKEYQTILGVDGMMVDMYQGDDIGAPEDFKNSGIVYMTNNLNCSVPFVLVEYSNGGIVGYNYMTGEYLFNHYVTNEMDLLDFAKVYFDGDKSMYAQVSNSYAANKKVAEIAGTSERLIELVEGNTNDVDVEGNSTGEGTKSESEDTSKADEDGEKTGTETEKTDGTSTAENGTSEGVDAASGEGEGVDKDTAGVTSESTEDGIGNDGSVEGSTDGAEGQGGTVQSSNNEDNGITGALGAESAAALTDAEAISGEGQGDGDIVTSGSAAGNGENVTSNGSLGGISDTTSIDEENSTGAKIASTEGGLNIAGNGTAKDAGTIGLGEEELTADKDSAAEDTVAGDGTGGAAGSGTKENASSDGSGIAGSGKGETAEAEEGSQSKDSSAKAASSEAAATKTSTAGTPIVEVTNGINNGTDNSSDLGTLDEEEKTDSKDEESSDSAEEQSNGELITVYNQSTGTYEIVDRKQYFSVPVYQSENQKLAIHDLSAYAGYAPEKEEKKHADGLILYILVAVAAIGGVGFIRYHRQRQKFK